MNKLDQKIQEINTEILVLAGKKSKLLAIKFDAKGGAGSGRYPAGSSGNGESSNPSSASLSPTALRERVSRLDGVSRMVMPTDKPASVTQASLDSDNVDVRLNIRDSDNTQSPPVFYDGNGKEVSLNSSVDQIQKTIGMHPADLREVLLAGTGTSAGDPQLLFTTQNSPDGTSKMSASITSDKILNKPLSVRIAIESDKDGNKTMKSNAYVEVTKEEAQGMLLAANYKPSIMNRVDSNIKDLAKAMGVTNIVQTRDRIPKF